MTVWSRVPSPACPGLQHEQEMNFYSLKSIAGLLVLNPGGKERTFLGGSSRSQQHPEVRQVRGAREEHYVFGQKVQILRQNLRKCALLPKFKPDPELNLLCPDPGTAMHPPPQDIHRAKFHSV